MLPDARLAGGTKAVIAGKRKAAADTTEKIKYLQRIHIGAAWNWQCRSMLNTEIDRIELSC